MKKVGGMGSGLSGLSGLSAIAGAAAAWTPASPTSDGGYLPHTWFYGGQPDVYQDNGLTTPAASDSDPIGGMVNQGSDAYNITQAAPIDKPKLRIGVNGLDDLPIFQFDGTDNLVGAFNGGAISQPNTIFVVGRMDATALSDGDTHPFLDGDDLSHRQAIVKVPVNTYRLVTSSSIDGGTVNSSWHIHTAVFNGASSIMRVDGALVISGDSGNHSMDGLTLGATANKGKFLIGDIAQVLIYDANLSDADKNQVAGYFTDTYGSLSYTTI